MWPTTVNILWAAELVLYTEPGCAWKCVCESPVIIQLFIPLSSLLLPFGLTNNGGSALYPLFCISWCCTFVGRKTQHNVSFIGIKVMYFKGSAGYPVKKALPEIENKWNQNRCLFGAKAHFIQCWNKNNIAPSILYMLNCQGSHTQELESVPLSVQCRQWERSPILSGKVSHELNFRAAANTVILCYLCICSFAGNIFSLLRSGMKKERIRRRLRLNLF